MGRFEFRKYEAINLRDIAGEIIRSHRRSFPLLVGKSWYRTRGFKELAYVHGSPQKSYRKTSLWLNRVRHQRGATCARTLQDCTEAEGLKLMEHVYQKAHGILRDQKFSQQGQPLHRDPQQPRPDSFSLPPETLEAVWNNQEIPLEWQAMMKANPIPYEDPAVSVNICIDDVGVKQQKEERQPYRQREVEPPEQKSNFAYQTVVHVENQTGRYVFNALGIGVALLILIAFLLHNDLLRGKVMVFLDGQRSLQGAVLNALSWVAPLQLILDWYHLEQKCQKQLSSALNNRHVRNQVLEKLLNWLWHGLIDPARDYLKTIESVYIKDSAALEKLNGYFERNRPFIPCYAIRKRLGLRNSSNIGEKSNDLLVSDRQKHNGMSWSQQGSASLAAITALVRNQESHLWFTTSDISFKLVPAIPF